FLLQRRLHICSSSPLALPQEPSLTQPRAASTEPPVFLLPATRAYTQLEARLSFPSGRKFSPGDCQSASNFELRESNRDPAPFLQPHTELEGSFYHFPRRAVGC